MRYNVFNAEDDFLAIIDVDSGEDPLAVAQSRYPAATRVEERSDAESGPHGGAE